MVDRSSLVVGAAGEAQVAQRLVVDGEDRAGRAVLGAHVPDRRPVGERHGGDAGAVELDELADDAVLAQHLGDREDQVGRGGALGQFAGELEADDAGDQHADRLAEHRGLGLDAADAPAEHTQSVDHGGVRVGAHHGVGISQPVAGEDDPGQVLEVDLVHDAGAGWHHLELVERGLAPAQELVALAVSVVLQFDVAGERVGGAEQVGDHRVVDDQFGGRERVDACRVAAQVAHRLAHGGEVDHRRYAGEVLHDDPRRGELNLRAWLGARCPVCDRLDLGAGDVLAVLGAQQVLEQHLQAERQARRTVDAVDAEVVDAGHRPSSELVSGSEAVLALRGHRRLLDTLVPANSLDVKILPVGPPGQPCTCRTAQSWCDR